jgi:glutathione S-transferase
MDTDRSTTRCKYVAGRGSKKAWEYPRQHLLDPVKEKAACLAWCTLAQYSTPTVLQKIRNTNVDSFRSKEKSNEKTKD